MTRAEAMKGVVLFCFLTLAVFAGGRAKVAAAANSRVGSSSIPESSLADFAFEQHPGAALPLDAVLRDESGKDVALDTFFGEKPVVLAFEYFRCPGLCGLVLDHLATALTETGLVAGSDYQLVVISIDPAETPADAAALKARHHARGGPAGAGGGGHFLTGDAAAVRSVADRVGFRYRYDAAIKEFAHPAGIVTVSPRGIVSGYLLGIDYSPLDLRLSLVEAGHGAIAAPATRLLLLCYGYDPATGRYAVLISRLIEVTAAITVLGLGGVILVAVRGAGSRQPRSGRV
jgi:protein SCO1/2